jgi:hypothetical protein
MSSVRDGTNGDHEIAFSVAWSIFLPTNVNFRTWSCLVDAFFKYRVLRGDLMNVEWTDSAPNRRNCVRGNYGLATRQRRPTFEFRRARTLCHARGGFIVPALGLGREAGASGFMAVLDVAGARS